MGVMSRQVLPLCSNLCFCCPALRARSRQPVKRYKKLLADIFPRSQGGEPNDRKIGKLCEYASKNPLRIPKITDHLEQKFYKNLRHENIVSVKAVLLVYGKLISSCKEQMPLFASSLLGIAQTLLEQAQHDEMQILGCHALVNFINNQVDSAYMFNLEVLIPKLCQLAEEVGDDERVLRLRSAGLEVLAVMVLFMGEQPHVSMDFENIISVTLENYMTMPINQENRQLSQAQEHSPGVPKEEYHRSSFSEVSKTSDFVNSKPPDVPPVDAHKNPSYWAQVCLHNMARSAKEVTTVRRVLEPLFHKFDTNKLWLPEKGLAFAVLKYLQMVLEESDDRSHLLLPILVKHLDHKDVSTQPVLQLHIVNVATQLSMYVKQHASVTIVGAITNLIKHYRKCLLRSFESSSPREGSNSCDAGLQCALENCISKLSCKVGDVGLILDIMAVVLENIPTSAAIARANLSALYRTAQVISSIPNITYLGKAFPDALFHHLLLAMSHPDHETRVLAHRVFSTVLIPSLSQPWSIHNLIPLQTGIPSMMSQKVADESFSIQYGNKSKPETIDEGTREKENHNMEHHVKHTTEYLSHGSIDPSTRDGKATPSSMRLSGRQVSLVLSSIWIQATSMENTPANFEAMAHTYTLGLSFILSKNSNHVALVRFFQLAFSLRSISLNRQGGLQPSPSQRRSLFMLASYMVIVTAKACHLPELIYLVRSTLTEETVDPYLVLDEDIRLQAICPKPDDNNCYGSQADEASAMKSLSAIELEDQQLKDTLSMHLASKIGKSSEEELLNMRALLSQCFLPDDEFPLGAPLFLETPQPCSPVSQMDFQAFDEAMPPVASTDEDACSDKYGSQSDRKALLPIDSHDILSVNQLLESVVETADHIESMPNTSTPVPYDHMKNQCEALVTGKQQKLSILQSYKKQQEAKAITSLGEHEKQSPISDDWAVHDDEALSCSSEYGQQQSFRLPSSCPFDKFLKPARC